MGTPEDPSDDTPPTYRTDPVPVEPEVPALVPYGPAPTGLADFSVAPGAVARVGRLPRTLFLIPVVAVLVVVVGVVAAVLGVGSGDDEVDAGAAGPADAQVLTAEGYDELVAAVEEETGGTTVFDAVLYPAYAVVSVPVDATTKRQESWYWDGTDLRSNNSKSTASFDRFDLASVDGAVVVDLVDRVRDLVEDPTSWYAIVRTSDPDGATMWAYASNEYDETAYLGAAADGTITYDSTQH
ncbi:hypothetical protein [Nocardioides conyzicola]|uniref:DUF5590 domain-containing protein n=1 Tax=Nocardioides conyzicola TaxID=1651781 RepID=A0ABP8WZT7_9ACTN